MGVSDSHVIEAAFHSDVSHSNGQDRPIPTFGPCTTNFRMSRNIEKRRETGREVLAGTTPGRELEKRAAMLWVDKYRPNQLEKLDYHEDITQQLQRIGCKENVNRMSHLLFYGPSGAGKKTRVMALLREVCAQSSLPRACLNRACCLHTHQRRCLHSLLRTLSRFQPAGMANELVVGADLRRSMDQAWRS